jgi:hypothetical protein
MPPLSLKNWSLAAVEVQHRLLPSSPLAKLKPQPFAKALLAHLRSPTRAPRLYTPASLKKTARLARTLDPDQHAWEKATADHALTRRVHAATDPYGENLIQLHKSFDFFSTDYPDPQHAHGLNRCRWFASLARIYWETQNPAYLQSLLWHWDLYSSRVPDPTPDQGDTLFATGPGETQEPPFHQLNTFIRLTMWWHAFWPSIHAPQMDAKHAVVLLARSLRLFDLVLAHGVRKQEHNFTSMQMQGLYYWATSLPEFSNMRAIQNLSRNTLEFSLARAVFPDGAHWEQSISYHIGCVTWYGGPALLGKLTNHTWSSAYLDRLQKMGALVDALIEPDGLVFSTSDSDRKTSWQIALGALAQLFPDQPYQHTASAGFDTTWLTGARLKKSPPPIPQTSGFKYFPNANLAVAKDISPPATSMLLFDNGSSDANHAHLDNLSICWSPLGTQALADPGRWIYVADDPDRIWVKSMQAHNTIWIDPTNEPLDAAGQRVAARMPPNDPRLSPIKTSHAQGLVTFESTFAGYIADRLAQATRQVIFPTADQPENARWLLVIDRFSAPTAHRWVTSWLTPGAELVNLTDSGFSASLKAGLSINCQMASDHPISIESEPKFWTPNYAQKLPAQWTKCAATAVSGLRAFLFSAGTGAQPQTAIKLNKGILQVQAPARTIQIDTRLPLSL